MRYLKVWTDFENVLAPLKDDEIGRLFVGMLHYAATGEEPQNFSGNEVFLWAVAKRDIDITAERAETLRQNGLKGGRPATKENQTEANETNENQTKGEKKRKEKKRNEIEKKDIFTPPTLAEITAYCKERNNGIDAEYFLDYQTARNWVLSNGKKCKDWKATIRTWEKNGYNKQRLTKVVTAQQYTQRDYSGEDADAMSRMLKLGGA